ncbi:TetR/AcrR family transcriptional regulator C-terminal domain-containing protein [Jiella sp. MQZ9-1]|uniref:TetR/AcrR family transcriptional regulator C-terminal domain-containing protein n=1 Tax=Jiella flava TaxID=2816857 RepID=A0A939FVW3_9HYPH|nr:TetR/AcrR family transcriptional regulator C-terminal domain-containing protein [Jiella flava]MBO0662415.1 TetR/AcrR family transcriptional regulator C-terminal domain-containing protein [Jiella flava]MCD2471639.1 TetR/AcrR family transcriptional regulator C-terminal domain-containing protein [Jiella flava]
MTRSDRAAAQAAPARPARAKGGRPTREEAARRHQAILDTATRLFLDKGFEGTSLETVADLAGVSKATVYAQYTDKRSLFSEVLRQRIAAWLEPLSQFAEAESEDSGCRKSLADKLDDVSRYMIDNLRTPETISLQRSLIATAPDFPELAELAEKEGWRRAVRAVATLLEQHAARGEIRVADPEQAADLFLSMITAPYTSLPLLPAPDVDGEVERRRRAALVLFLAAIRQHRDEPRRDWRSAPASAAPSAPSSR